jgi:hypothetical protein
VIAMVSELIVFIVTFILTLLSGLGIGRATTKKINYQYPKCAHVWEKWEIVEHIPTGSTKKHLWGQSRKCDLCGYTEWEKFGAS